MSSGNTVGISTETVDTVQEALGSSFEDKTVRVEITVEDIGGIDNTTVEFQPGLTILSGENATNRTSFLRAVNGILGGNEAVLRSGASEGFVEMEITRGDDGDAVTFRREYSRASSAASSPSSSVSVSGQGFYDDAELVDTYVTLLEWNAARDSIRRGGEDLREILMLPVDTDEIDAEIQLKTRERESLQSRLDEIDEAAEREIELTEKKQSLESELEEVTSDIAELERAVEELEETEELASEAQELVDELDMMQSAAQSVRGDLNVLEAERDAVREEKQDLQQEAVKLYCQVTGEDSGDVDVDAVDWNDESLDSRITEFQSDVQDLRGRRDGIEDVVDDLLQIVSINNRVIEDVAEYPEFVPDRDGDVAAELLPEEDVECWTCGTVVQQGVVSGRVSEIRELIQEKRGVVNDLDSELDEKETTLEGLREARRARDRVRDRLGEIDEERDEIDAEIEEKEADLEEVEAEIEELREKVSETEDIRESELLQTREALNNRRYEHGRLEERISSVESEIEEIEELRGERENVEAKHDRVRGEIEELRDRVEELEKDAVMQFNSAMEDVLGSLSYSNIARVWIERKVADRSSSNVVDSSFELHVVRDSEDGGAWEDSVSNLSESEREVTGLIVALTGYIVHDVRAAVPFLLLDSVEAVDADRLVTLVEYFLEETTFMLVALLPEDATAFSDEYPRVTPDRL